MISVFHFGNLRRGVGLLLRKIFVIEAKWKNLWEINHPIIFYAEFPPISWIEF
jgi:hypothetical protein